MLTFEGVPEPPAWAKNEEDVIGYTMRRRISHVEASHRIILPPPPTHPTIYYKLGRLTVQHDTKVGWQQVGGNRCEFFGNIDGSRKVPVQPTQSEVAQLLRDYPSYCTNGSSWAQVQDGHDTWVLVEVWELHGFRMSHTSRNRFHWAGTDEMKYFLHQLAQGASMPKKQALPKAPPSSGKRPISPRH